jgi:hypothetical protein
MNVEQVVGQCIALVVTNAEKEGDVHVYAGLLQIHDGQYSFVNEEKGWRVQLVTAPPPFTRPSTSLIPPR